MNKIDENMTNNYKNVQKIKLNNVSLIRFISFTCIFFFHMILFWTPFGRQYFPLWFAVQVFLFISGFLYSKKEIANIKSFYIKNGLKILIPAGIFIIFYFAVYLIAYLCGFKVFLFEIIPHGIPATGLGHYWFIYAICACYLITPILYKLSEAMKQKDKLKSYRLMLLILIFIVIDAMLSQAGCQSIVTSFVLGYLFKYIYDSKFFQKHKDGIAFVCFVVFVLATLFYYYLVNSGGGGDVSFYTTTACKELLMITFAVSFTIFMLVTFEFLNHRKFKFNKFLQITDKYSFYIYLTHNTTLCGCFATIHYINNIYLAGFVALCLTLTLAVALQFVSQKSINYCSKKFIC